MTASDVLEERLIDCGVEAIFGLPGDGINGFVEARRVIDHWQLFSYIEFLSKPGQALGIQIHHRPERIELRYPVDIALVGDAQATLRELLMYLPRNEG